MSPKKSSIFTPALIGGWQIDKMREICYLNAVRHPLAPYESLYILSILYLCIYSKLPLITLFSIYSYFYNSSIFLYVWLNWLNTLNLKSAFQNN